MSSIAPVSPCAQQPWLTSNGHRVDIYENPETNMITATWDLPGVKPEEVIIEVDQDLLSVSGETGTSEERDERGYTVRERSWGKFSFSRPLMLPQGTKVSVVEILFANFLPSDRNAVARRGQGKDGIRCAECDIPKGSASAAAHAHHHRVSASSS
jgi:hypothetical protein